MIAGGLCGEAGALSITRCYDEFQAARRSATAMNPLRSLNTLIRRTARQALLLLPRRRRYRVRRFFAAYDQVPGPRLVVKIAESREELEACFRLLHDRYVRCGYMAPDVSGMRVTIYHALPTTTILCALFDGRVVGTLALIRENVMGLPLQRIFDLTAVRAKHGKLAEVSGLAIAPDFRGVGGLVLLPLLKFVYEYCTALADIRHLLIATHPRDIETYEALLFFRRLSGGIVPNYDFVNGAPAVGARLDLKFAPEILRRYYGERPLRHNLHHYFVTMRLPNLKLPTRPVEGMPPELLDYFFNRQTHLFATLSERRKQLLHLIYDRPDYRRVLPPLAQPAGAPPVRQHRRFPFTCRGRLAAGNGSLTTIAIEISEVSRYGFRAGSAQEVPQDTWMTATILVSQEESARLQVRCVQTTVLGGKCRCGFQIGEPDLVWRKFVNALHDGRAAGDIDQPSRFLPDH